MKIDTPDYRPDSADAYYQYIQGWKHGAMQISIATPAYTWDHNFYLGYMAGSEARTVAAVVALKIDMEKVLTD
jgi:hypothetical protein